MATALFVARDNDPISVGRRKIGPTTTVCATCGTPAGTARHVDFECHSCSDWFGCGSGDCNIWASWCVDCGTWEIIRQPHPLISVPDGLWEAGYRPREVTVNGVSRTCHKPLKSFSMLHPYERDRAIAAGSQYGLTKAQVRSRFDVGSFHPFASGDAQVPLDVWVHPDRYPLDVQRRLAADRAVQLIGRSILTNPAGFTADAIRDAVEAIDDPAALKTIIHMSGRDDWVNRLIARTSINEWLSATREIA